MTAYPETNAYAPFQHPAAWRAPELGDKKDLAIALEERYRVALLHAVDKSLTVPLLDLTPESFNLSSGTYYQGARGGR